MKQGVGGGVAGWGTCLIEEDLAVGDGDVEEEAEVGHCAVLPRATGLSANK
jgi:hypothetical protein